MMGQSVHFKNGRCKTESLPHQVLCRLNQSNLDQLNKCADRSSMKFNRGKCQALYLGRNKPVCEYSLGVIAVKQTCRRRSWGHGRQQTEPPVYSWSNENQLSLGWYWEEHCQEVKGGSFLFAHFCWRPVWSAGPNPVLDGKAESWDCLT